MSREWKWKNKMGRQKNSEGGERKKEILRAVLRLKSPIYVHFRGVAGQRSDTK